jgi:hypothetical protein
MKVYISGPMSGIPDLNRRAFDRAARILRYAGHSPMIPHDLTPPRLDGESDDSHYVRCLEADLAALLQCEAIRLLPGWHESKGARIELHRALELGIEVMP